jgi:hypothetical protein
MTGETRYYVLTTGPRVHYIVDSVTRDFVGAAYRAKRDAVKRCAEKNAFAARVR